ncbi:MAG: hypothetical protein ACTHJR_03310 [Sphingomonas sp.]|uniref:hypothetical protein n=1 Tax=Sphingomonas sp. TaxID=28214 RepID=UPI003F7F5471
MSPYARLLPLAALALSAAASASPPDDLGLVDAAIKAGRLVQAQTMLDLLPSDNTDTTEVAILRAQLLLAQGSYAAAAAAFAKLATTAGDDCRVIAGRGIAATELRQTEPAIALLRAATTRCPSDGETWSELGRALAAGEHWSDSRVAYDRALALDGRRPSLLNDMAVSLLMERRYAEAKALLLEARAVAPEDLRIANNLDIAAASLGEAPVRPAGEEAARWAERLSNAGYAALLAGRVDDARAWLSQSIAAAPVFPAATAKMLSSLEPRK